MDDRFGGLFWWRICNLCNVNIGSYRSRLVLWVIQFYQRYGIHDGETIELLLENLLGDSNPYFPNSYFIIFTD